MNNAAYGTPLITYLLRSLGFSRGCTLTFPTNCVKRFLLYRFFKLATDFDTHRD